jgi:cytochrome o ubiquinol oxidase operon protein cyoD
MSARKQPDAHDAHGFSRRVYLIGFLLSVVLTAVPFWLVMTGTHGQSERRRRRS